jgi:hypothetical protein
MKRTRLVVLGITIGAIMTGGVAFGVNGQPAATTYYACLAKGKLSKVGTTSPTCSSKTSAISWDSVGPPGPQGSPGQFVYDWNTTFPGTGAGFDEYHAATVLTAGSEITVLSASITGDFSSCPSTVVDFGDPGTSSKIAIWQPSGSVTDQAPSTTESATLDSSASATMTAFCGGNGTVPTFSFNIVFTVLPPPTPYS